MKTSILTIFIFLLSFLNIAQEKGFLRGNIADGDAGGPLYGAKIKIKEIPSVGALSDFDGNYNLNLAPGIYTVEILSASFTTLEFKAIEIIAGKATVLDAILKPAVNDLVTVVVTATARKDSETSILLERKNATIVTDGISAQNIKKNGDSDLSGAIKRVTGVSIKDGKYVYVRGLGDRYTQTTLNGVIVPGLDPDVNSLQLDIFPTAVLENLQIYKTASPEFYGDFTGGLVNIVTKKFPAKKTTQIGFGLGFTPGMHFNKDFILYDQGKLDFLGFDDGSRALPFNSRKIIPDETQIDPELEKITRSFNKQLAVKSKTALPNGSFSFNHGNQKSKDNGATFGYNLVLNYSNENQFFQDYESNDFLKNTESNVNPLFQTTSRKGNLGKNTVLWSALATSSFKKKDNALQISFLNIQNG